MQAMPTLDAAWRTGRNHFNLIRLVAAWLVIWSHAWAITGTAGNDHFARLTTRSAGAFAVDVFFVISGFLVAASLQRNQLARLPPRPRAAHLSGAGRRASLLTVFVLGPLAEHRARLLLESRHLALPVVERHAVARRVPPARRLRHPAAHGRERVAVDPADRRPPVPCLLFVAGLLGMLAPKRYVPAWALAIAGAAGFAWMSRPLPEHLEYLLWVTAFFITGTLLWVLRAKIRLSWWLWLPMLLVAALTRGSPWFVPAYLRNGRLRRVLPRLPRAAAAHPSHRSVLRPLSLRLADAAARPARRCRPASLANTLVATTHWH